MSMLARICLVLAVSADASAQLAPTGGHYAGRPSDTGFESLVNSTGAFSATVPLDLPAARGDVPVPLAIQYGAHSVGAAGLGWDIPLSFVRVDSSFEHRRPIGDITHPPQGRQRISLTIMGQGIDMVPHGATWVGQRGGTQLTLVQAGASWIVYDGQGLTYTFSRVAAPGLVLLSSITGPANKVQLSYDVETPSGGISIDLTDITYNPPASGSCAKHEIAISYGGNVNAAPWSINILGGVYYLRYHTVDHIDVKSRTICTATPAILRTYKLGYLPDGDTAQPRLSSVTVTARADRPENNTLLPVVSYQYASATAMVPIGNTGLQRALVYNPVQWISLPTGADPNQTSSTSFDTTVTTPGNAFGFSTWQSLIDVTGDGRPDLVYPSGGKLYYAVNQPISGGNTSFANPGPLGDSHFSSGPLENRELPGSRYTPNLLGSDKVWRQAIDMNGDGRVDIVDAAAQTGHWVVYLNTPGATPSAPPVWVPKLVSLTPMYNALHGRGFPVGTDYIPLASRATGDDYNYIRCALWSGQVWSDDNGGWGQGTCHSTDNNNQDHQDGPSTEKTFVEWELKDINGDGYPDLVYNSNPAVTTQTWPTAAPPPGPPTPALQHGSYTFQPPTGNVLLALVNVAGVRLDELGTAIFAQPISLRGDSASCGISEWKSILDGDGKTSTQQVVCELGDVNGDGLIDRIENGSSVFLGTGAGFTTAVLTLPGPYQSQVNGQGEHCSPTSDPKSTYPSALTAGLRDVTGDGIPDYLESIGSAFMVAIGTGTGFTDFVPIDAPFGLSSDLEQCDGMRSLGQGGLFDIDGDGRPDIVGLDPALNAYQVYQLYDSTFTERGPAAGKLVGINNGFGAQTTITYRSAKEDPATPHQVPFPEIVVSTVATSGTLSLGGTLATTKYAYGKSQIYFDPLLDRFTMPAYGRVVKLVNSPAPAGGPDYANVTITNSYPWTPFPTTGIGPNGVALTPQQRFGRYLQIGRTSDVLELGGNLGADPWALVGDNFVSPGNVLLGSTHYDWDTRLTNQNSTDPIEATDCIDIMFPYDYRTSINDNLGTNVSFDACLAYGFELMLDVDSWRGTAAPPSTSNVETRTEVQAVDALGRVTSVRYRNDLAYGDADDLCVDTTFAQPTGTTAHLYSAISARKVSNCIGSGGDAATFLVDTYGFDLFPPGTLTVPGSVSSGFVTSHAIENHTSGGADRIVSSIQDYNATYDAVGNPIQVVSIRAETGGAHTTRTVNTEYDPFALAAVHIRTDGTGLPSFNVYATLDPLTLDHLGDSDANGTVRGISYDGFGRPIMRTLTPPGGTTGALLTLSYQGFDGTNSNGRDVSVNQYSDPVPLANLGTAIPHVVTTFYDELGRERLTQAPLGADYAGNTMIIGQKSYDSLGRVAFEADPFPMNRSVASTYGTTRYFSVDGTPLVVLRGNGQQPFTTVPDAVNELFPTLYTHSFANYQEQLSVQGPDSLTPGTPQAGVVRATISTAIGEPIFRSTWQNGVRIEHAAFSYDRLGRLAAMSRFQSPGTATNAVSTFWARDSLGRALTVTEPLNFTQTRSYSDWDELTSVQWTPPAPEAAHSLTRSYDAFGRTVQSQEQNNGVADAATLRNFFYDTGAAISPQVTPTFLAGRLSRAVAPTGDVYFSYDAYGHVNARTFTDEASAWYVEKHSFHADGTPSQLELDLPDNAYAPERVDYGYDSVGRVRSLSYSDGSFSEPLFTRQTVDPYGRTLTAQMGAAAYAAAYATTGRRLIQSLAVTATGQSNHQISYLGFDAVGRETSRTDWLPSAQPLAQNSYDALGRLSGWHRSNGATNSRTFSYDPLGNATGVTDSVTVNNVSTFYNTTDYDRLCAVYYGPPAPHLPGCNVLYDGAGNVTSEPTRGHTTRTLSYYNSGRVRSINDSTGATANFLYDALGGLQELNLTGGPSLDQRHDRHYGGRIAKHDQTASGVTTSVISRQFSAAGISAVRRGAGGPWVFQFGEPRGTRFTADQNGTFLQSIDYMPYGEAVSGGTTAGTAQYSSEQFNGGDSLAALGVVDLGARVYDPVIGRFLSRDPLKIPRTAATTNPYAFAMNDPINNGDPSGLDCMGPECQHQPPPPDDDGFFDEEVYQAFIAPVPSAPKHASTPPAPARPPDDGLSTFERFALNYAGKGWQDPSSIMVGPIVYSGIDTGKAFGHELDMVWKGARGEATERDVAEATLDALNKNNITAGHTLAAVFPFLGGGAAAAATAAEGIGEELAGAGDAAGAVARGSAAVAAEAAPKACSGGGCSALGRCFVAGTLVATANGEVPIEKLQLGDRVEAGNPSCAGEHLAAGTVRIGLDLANPANPRNLLHFELARPRSWLAEHHLESGQGWLEIPELELAGPVRVTHVVADVHEAAGDGCLVLMTLNQLASRLLKLEFEGGTLVELTPGHRLYVEGRGWVRAGEMAPGELLRTDRGPLRLIDVTEGRPDQQVFNLEVGVEHAYRVSAERIWSHNVDCISAAREFVRYIEELQKWRKAVEFPEFDIFKNPDELQAFMDRMWSVGNAAVDSSTDAAIFFNLTREEAEALQELATATGSNSAEEAMDWFKLLR